MEIDKVREFSVKEAAELLGMPHLEVNRRIRKGDIKAHKVGWFWVIYGRDLISAVTSDWYQKRLMKQ